MIGVNTAIARVAPDGMPITSISFSLKSSVARQWLREQGTVSSQLPALPTSGPTRAAAEVPAAQPPMQQPIPAPRPVPNQTPAPKMVSPKNQSGPVQPLTTPPSPRAYNLDELVSDRSKAEADLDGMISEMRGRVKER